MCGLGVILTTSKADAASRAPLDAIPSDWVCTLDDAVRHRGPHGSGMFRDRVTDASGRTVDVAMVHRRLSVIDHAGGGQPMVSDAPDGSVDPDSLAAGRGRVAVVFNGHIVNHRELRATLESLGHRFVSDHADTEVLVHGWRAWGELLAEKLVGMFAVAVWDADTARVWTARDRFGEKPLYECEPVDGVWAACSNAKGLADLMARTGATPAIDARALRSWATMGHDACATPWRGVRQSRPCVDVSVVTTDPDAESQLETPDGIRQAVTDRISRSVRDRLEADVPVGCLLSSGVDSAVVASFAAEHLRARGSELTALTVRMPDVRYDESKGARSIAGRIGAEHIVVDADASQAADDLVMLVRTLGLPFGDSSLLPTYWVCRAAAARVGVALTGDGGDELFLGYERYAAAKWLAGPIGTLAGVGRFDTWVPRRDPKSKWAKLARLSEAARHGGYSDLLSIFPTPIARAVFGKGQGRQGESASPPPPPRDAISARSFDLRSTLPGDYLRKSDSASMIAHLEHRAPLLDSDLADLVLGLSERTLLPGGERKGLLRAIARDRLPASLIDRPKMGFAIPIGRWLREDFGGLRSLCHDLLRAGGAFAGLPLDIDRRAVARLLDRHDAGRDDHGQRLYALMVLAIWARDVAEPSGAPRQADEKTNPA